MAVTFQVALAVEADNPAELVKALEILSSTQAGLALEGFDTALTVERDVCDCDNHEDDEDTEDTTI